jgi:eukaryotic-like serine/threonine-protein kinase
MLAEGTVLQGRYHIGKVLGKGGMGVVYRARDANLDCDVAVKQAFFNDDDDLRAAFEREAKLLRKLTHANLPKVTDLFTEGSVQYLVMDFIAGRTLKELLRASGGTIPTEQALGWADQVLAVLEYLHGRTPPVIHRDIKPANLKLTESGDLYLLDFGLAKGFHTQASRTFGASVAGHTPGYSPIEQMQGAGTDGRSDLYALGATLYHLVTGVAPPDAGMRVVELAAEQGDPLRPAHEVNPKIPARISAALERALAMSPSKRPATADEMRQELRDAIAEPRVVRPAVETPAPKRETTQAVKSVAPPPLVAPVRDVVEGESPVEEKADQPHERKASSLGAKASQSANPKPATKKKCKERIKGKSLS